MTGMSERVFKKVQAHMGWTREKTHVWFKIKNPYFGGLTPYDFMVRRPDKMERYVDSLINEHWMPPHEEKNDHTRDR